MASTLGAGGSSGGGAAGFDPASFNMGEMRKKMQDPEMLRMMQARHTHTHTHALLHTASRLGRLRGPTGDQPRGLLLYYYGTC